MINLIIITITIFLTLFLLQLKYPNYKFSKNKRNNSIKTNSIIFIFNNIIIKSLSITILYLIAFNYSNLGLFKNFELNIYTYIFFIIFLDFLIYVWHLLNHRISFFWIFHKAHHSDDAISTFSALRFHIGELILSILFKSIIIIIFAIPVEVVLFSEFLITIFAMFEHSNFKFKFEKVLSKIFIVPHLHYVHHSRLKKEYDSNYGVIFSIWDKLFKTYLWTTPKSIGLNKIENQNFIEFLKFGFKK